MRLRQRSDSCFSKAKFISISNSQRDKAPQVHDTDFLDRYENRDSHENTSAGRLRVITARTRRRLVRESKKARRLPLRELANEVAPNASERTIRRVLAEEDTRKWRAKRALLTENHVAQRLAWAKA